MRTRKLATRIRGLEEEAKRLREAIERDSFRSYPVIVTLPVTPTPVYRWPATYPAYPHYSPNITGPGLPDPSFHVTCSDPSPVLTS